MRPETVLALKPGGDPKAAAAEWAAAYAAAARECPADKALCERLTRRAEDACALCCERAAYVPSPCHDEAYYTAFAEAREREDAALDGGFPLGNEADAAFAGDYFSVPELVQLQCGRAQRIDAGTFNGYNFDVLVRRGFLAEAAGDFAEAARCYGGVSTSRSVQEREYACRRRAEEAQAAEAARAALQARIDDGDRDALWQMAQLCKRENDPDGAAAWFTRAVVAGQTDALIAAARVYADRDGENYDKKAAEGLLRRAAENGSAAAMIALGDMALADTAVPFWQQAAQLRELSAPGRPPKRKIVRQHRAQMAWYRSAAAAGDTSAMNALGMAYHLGYPEKRDDAQAFLWVSRAADAGDGEAMYQAAYLTENGFGTDRDIDAALLLYAEAAELGVRAAAIRLHEIYTAGLLHIPPDGKKAAYYLFKSGEESEGEAE